MWALLVYMYWFITTAVSVVLPRDCDRLHENWRFKAALAHASRWMWKVRVCRKQSSVSATRHSGVCARCIQTRRWQSTLKLSIRQESASRCCRRW